MSAPELIPGDGPPPVRIALADALERLWRDLSPERILKDALKGPLAGRVAAVSSFGAESAALLHMIARIDRATPVIFIDTMMLFPETLAYQRELAARLGLTDLRVIRAAPEAVAGVDPDSDLHRRDPNACCDMRKTAPLAAALAGFDGWITGAKRGHGGDRAGLPVAATDGAGRLRIAPLAAWPDGEAARYIRAKGLPPHPLVAQGYRSLGCAPCTTPTSEGEGARAGRWRGAEKTECGVQFVGGRAQPV